MTAPTITKRDAVDAALSVAEDVTAGKLRPADIEAEAVAELLALVDIDAEPGSPVAGVQAAAARRALAAGLIPADELHEWLSVARSRAEAASWDNDPRSAGTPGSGAASEPESVPETEADPDPEAGPGLRLAVDPDAGTGAAT